MFNPGDKIFLVFSNIYTVCLSTKLSHYCLRSYVVEKQVEPMACCLKLPSALQRLHLVFYIIKLTPAPEDSISGRYSSLSLSLIIINKEEEWEIEKILDSCWHCQRYQYLIK